MVHWFKDKSGNWAGDDYHPYGKKPIEEDTSIPMFCVIKKPVKGTKLDLVMQFRAKDIRGAKIKARTKFTKLTFSEQEKFGFSLAGARYMEESDWQTFKDSL